jgi:hypothetical protein
VVVVVVANNPPNRNNTMCLKTFLLRQLLLLPREPRSFGKLKDHQCLHCRVQFSQFLSSSSIGCFLSLQFKDMQQSSNNNSQCSSMQQLLLFQYKVQQRAAGGLFLAKMLWSNLEVYKYNNSNPHKFKSLQVVM